MAIYGALAPALPDRVSAHDGGTSALVAVGGVHPDTGDVVREPHQRGLRLGRPADEGRQQRPLHPKRQLRPPAGRDPRDALPDRSTRRSRSTRDRRGRSQPRRLRLPPPVPGGCRRRCACPASSRRSRHPPVGPLRRRARQELRTASVSSERRRDFQDVDRRGFGVACNGKFSDVYLARGDAIRIVTSGGGGYGAHRSSATSTASRRTSARLHVDGAGRG